MKIVDGIVTKIRAKNDKLKQAISTGDVINWFKNIKYKKQYKFINWDMDNYYASIKPTLLKQSLDWATEYVDMTPQQGKIIHPACQSCLYFRGQPWMNERYENFDVGTGAYNGA